VRIIKEERSRAICLHCGQAKGETHLDEIVVSFTGEEAILLTQLLDCDTSRGRARLWESLGAVCHLENPNG